MLGKTFSNCSGRVDALTELNDLIHHRTTISKVKASFEKISKVVSKDNLTFDRKWIQSFVDSGLEDWGSHETVKAAGKVIPI